MPTFPLYLQHPHPTDASHHVIAPGGYEWWHFEANHERGAGRVIIDFILGDPFHQEYRRRLARYMRRPTRHLPPTPNEYPRVSVGVYEAARLTGEFTQGVSAGEMRASIDRLSICAGENGAEREEGGIRVWIAVPGLSGELMFRFADPWQALERGDSAQRWVVMDPPGTVEGQMSFARGGRQEVVQGRGYHDYAYGTRMNSELFGSRRRIRHRDPRARLPDVLRASAAGSLE